MAEEGCGGCGSVGNMATAFEQFAALNAMVVQGHKHLADEAKNIAALLPLADEKEAMLTLSKFHSDTAGVVADSVPFYEPAEAKP